MADYKDIAGRIRTTASDGVSVEAQEILDISKNKKQSQINAETATTLANHASAIQGLNSQNYKTYTATDQTTAETDVLPAEGSEDTIYRLGNWDGIQYDVTCYSLYSWNGSAYVHISTKSQIGEVFDISVYHATGGELAKYTDLAAALDSNNGGGVPQSLQKGGMSVKFVLTSDNKYVQYRLMSDTFNTTPANWQGVDDEPTAGSDSLVKSVGILKNDIEFSKITFFYGGLLNSGAIYLNRTLKNKLCSSYIKGPFEYTLDSDYRVLSACKYNSVGKFISYTLNNIDALCRNNERDNLILISLGRNDNGAIEDNYNDIITIKSLMLNTIDNSISELNSSIFGKDVTMSSYTNIPVKVAKGEVVSITTDKGFTLSVISNGVQEVINTFINAGTYIYKADKNIEYIRITDFSGTITISLQKVKYDNVINALRCNSVIKGTVSIIGDSISTFKGTMPSGYAAYYPDARVNITCVGSMWWKMLLDSGNNNTLIENLSWSGSCATNYRTDGRPSLCDRISALSSTPDYLFIALGTNDSNENVPLGNYSYDSDIIELDESKFREAFIKGIKLMQRDHASTKLILLAFDMRDGYKNSLISIAKHYNIPLANIVDYDKFGSHPTKKGMEEAAAIVVDTFSKFELKDAINNANEITRGVAGEVITKKIVQASNFPYYIAEGDTIIITNDSRCSFSYISDNTQYPLKMNAEAGTYMFTIPRDVQQIRITDIVNIPTTVSIKRKSVAQYMEEERDYTRDYTDERILGKVETASLTSNNNINFEASEGEKIVISIDRECSISLMYDGGQQIYRLHAPVGSYSIVLTDNLNAVRFTELVSVTNVRIRLDNSLPKETDIELDALQYGVEKFIANNGANFYSQLSVMYNSAKNNTDTVLKRVTTNAIHYAHMPQMIINDGIVYLSYLQNAGDGGEGTYSTTSSVVLAKFSLSDFNSENFNPSTDVEIFEIGKLGDTFANYQAKSIFKDNSMCLVGDIIYIPFMFITEEENAARMFVAAFDTTTDTITSKHASTISYGGDSLDFTINTINTIYIKEGYNVVPVTNNIIELVSEWSIYNNEYYATLICSGSTGNTGMIVKTTDFVNYTFVSCIPFNQNGEAEIASIVFDGKLYVACRQNYGIPYLMLGYYNLSDGTWSNPTKIADGNSRPWLFIKDNKLYLANTIQEYYRYYFNISLVSTTHYIGKNIPVTILSSYYNKGYYFAITEYSSKLYMVIVNNTISFGELKLSEISVSQAQQKLLDLFA